MLVRLWLWLFYRKGTLSWTIEVIAATAGGQYVDFFGPILTTVGTEPESFDRAGRLRPLTGSVAWDPGLIAAAGSETTTLTVNGARAGDMVNVGLPSGLVPHGLAGLTLSAWVSAVNTVSLRLDNPSAAGVNLASGTWRVAVEPTT